MPGGQEADPRPDGEPSVNFFALWSPENRLGMRLDVAVRLRPALGPEKGRRGPDVECGGRVLSFGPGRSFECGQVIGPGYTQRLVFHLTVEGLVDESLLRRRFPCLLVAGTPGGGKTHTVEGVPADDVSAGLLFHALDYLTSNGAQDVCLACLGFTPSVGPRDLLNNRAPSSPHVIPEASLAYSVDKLPSVSFERSEYPIRTAEDLIGYMQASRTGAAVLSGGAAQARGGLPPKLSREPIHKVWILEYTVQGERGRICICDVSVFPRGGARDPSACDGVLKAVLTRLFRALRSRASVLPIREHKLLHCLRDCFHRERGVLGLLFCASAALLFEELEPSLSFVEAMFPRVELEPYDDGGGDEGGGVRGSVGVLGGSGGSGGAFGDGARRQSGQRGRGVGSRDGSLERSEGVGGPSRSAGASDMSGSVSLSGMDGNAGMSASADSAGPAETAGTQQSTFTRQGTQGKPLSGTNRPSRVSFGPRGPEDPSGLALSATHPRQGSRPSVPPRRGARPSGRPGRGDEELNPEVDLSRSLGRRSELTPSEASAVQSFANLASAGGAADSGGADGINSLANSGAPGAPDSLAASGAPKTAVQVKATGDIDGVIQRDRDVAAAKNHASELEVLLKDALSRLELSEARAENLQATVDAMHRQLQTSTTREDVMSLVAEETQALRNSVEELTAQVLAKEDEIFRLHQDNKRLKGLCNATSDLTQYIASSGLPARPERQSRPLDDGRVDQLLAQLSESEAKAAALQKRLDEQVQEISRAQALREENRKLQEELSEVKGICVERLKHAEALEHRILDLTADNDELRREAATLAERCQATQKESEARRCELMRLETVRQDLMEAAYRAQVMEGGYREVAEANKGLRAELDARTNVIEQLSREVGYLRSTARLRGHSAVMASGAAIGSLASSLAGPSSPLPQSGAYGDTAGLGSLGALGGSFRKSPALSRAGAPASPAILPGNRAPGESFAGSALEDSGRGVIGERSSQVGHSAGGGAAGLPGLTGLMGLTSTGGVGGTGSARSAESAGRYEYHGNPDTRVYVDTGPSLYSGSAGPRTAGYARNESATMSTEVHGNPEASVSGGIAEPTVGPLRNPQRAPGEAPSTRASRAAGTATLSSAAPPGPAALAGARPAAARPASSALHFSSIKK